jgi:two-component system CheB/CheR fusion protein
MAREGLRHELTVTLQKAVGTKEVSRAPGLRVKTNGDFTWANLTILPVVTGPSTTTETPLFLILLEEVEEAHGEEPAHPDGIGTGAKVKASVDIASLRQELRAKEEYLQTTNEELETSNEELKSSNEEMQSVNEELQSTNEEMATSKEELQSVNEELATVNTELQTKLADLTRANNDMNNLLAGTGVATVFVDHRLRILRFTPTATRIINLIPGDVGRPVGHIVSKLVGYDRLLSDAQAVLDSLVPKEIDVQTAEDRWYTMRILPYRTLDNMIEGVVLTFMDITEKKKTEAALHSALEDIKTLRGLIPICANCKKIRDDEGFWHQVEAYISDRTEAKFSHGICPDCVKILYPDLDLDDESTPEENQGHTHE